MKCMNCSRIDYVDGYCNKYNIYIKDGNEEHSECDNEQDWLQTYFQSKENESERMKR